MTTEPVRDLPLSRLAGPVALTICGFVLHGIALAVAGGPVLPADGIAAQVLRGATGLWAWLALAWTGARLIAISLRHFPRLLTDLLVTALFAAAGIAVAIFVFQLPATGLIATSSVLIAVLGFALRNIIGDVFSGVVLGIDRPYRIGDWVEVTEGSAGRVVELTWRATRLVNPDGISFVIPNGLVAVHRLVNYSAEKGGPYRATLRVPLDPGMPPDRARRILLAAALEAERSWPGLAPDVILQEFAGGAAIYLVRFHPPDYGRDGPCRDAVAGAVLQALQRIGLGVARPSQEVTLARPGAGAPRRRREHLMEHTDLFRPFTPAERAALADAMAQHAFAKGQVLVRQGEAGRSLYLLAEGALDVTVAPPDGPPIALDRLLPGSVFGEMSLLTGQPRSATVVAATDGEVYEIDKAHLDPILRERPSLAEALGAVMAERQARNAERRRAADLPAPPAPSREDLMGRLRAFFKL